MLTEDEKKWLERREDRHSATGYYISLWDFPGKSLFGMTERTNYKDAAEFEARVAAKLAESEDCHITDDCAFFGEECAWCKQKDALLAVEREMIAEGKKPGRKEA